MSEFKAGDYVVPLRAWRAGCTYEMKKRIGKVLQVSDTNGSIGDLTVFAGKIGSKTKKWFWHPVDLRMATAGEIEAATKPKPLKRGDLVVYDARVCVVFDKQADHDADYRIAFLSGECGYEYVPADELKRICSIRKKIKRIRSSL